MMKMKVKMKIPNQRKRFGEKVKDLEVIKSI